MIGTRLGHYYILEKLGEGGMGVVYKARDTHLERFVAVKVLPPERMADPTRRQRFVHEARSASALNHPNIVTVYDIDQSGGIDFISMEYVEGQTLEEMIVRKRPKPGEALKYGVQIADALAKAHAAGIVHRDLKPSNIMVTNDGAIKVLDFGLAKLTEQKMTDEFAETRTLQPVLRTEAGSILGTAAYMSPEQAEGKAIDARSDIFSFGAVLYEVLSGCRAFRGGSPAATLAAVLTQEPEPLPGLVPAIPSELDRLIARCLRKDPERRLSSMADLRVALEELRQESESGGVARGRSSRPWSAAGKRRWIGLIAGGCLFAAALYWFLQRSGTDEPALKETPITSYPGSEQSPSFSPDGSQIAFAWNGENQDNFDIYVKVIGTDAPLRLTTDPADDTNPSWSPDGRTIAFLRAIGSGQYAVLLIPALGGVERKLLDISVARLVDDRHHLAWLPDSKSLVVAHQDSLEHPSGLWLVSTNRAERRQLTFAPTGTPGDSGPAVAPDGSAVVFTRATDQGPADLHLLHLDKRLAPAGEPKRITFFNWWGEGVAWAPGGNEIVFCHGGHLWRIPLSRFGSRPGKPRRLETLGMRSSSPALSRQGRRLAYSVHSGGDLDIWRAAIPGRNTAGTASPPAKFVSSTWDDFAAEYSPDGSKMVFESARSGTLEIWVCGSDGSNCVQLTSFGGPATGLPRWSPDGRRIAFYSRLGRQAQIHVMNADGSAVQALTGGAFENRFPNWSRDGRWIYFSSNRGGADQIWRMPASGGEPVQVTKNGGMAAMESPDGKYIYYTKTMSQASTLWRMPVEGGPETLMLESVTFSNYQVTGRGVYFMTQPDPKSSRYLIQLLSFADHRTKLIASTDRIAYVGLSVSPDERWVTYAVKDRDNRDLVLVENFE